MPYSINDILTGKVPDNADDLELCYANFKLPLVMIEHLQGERILSEVEMANIGKYMLTRNNYICFGILRTVKLGYYNTPRANSNIIDIINLFNFFSVGHMIIQWCKAGRDFYLPPQFQVNTFQMKNLATGTQSPLDVEALVKELRGESKDTSLKDTP